MANDDDLSFGLGGGGEKKGWKICGGGEEG